MKKLLAVAALSLIVLGLGTDRASAFGCCKFWYKAPAAQYNAFSPFCCNAVVGGRCGKCAYVADCCPQPCYPPCPPDCCVTDPCAGLPAAPAQAPATPAAPAAPAAQPHGMLPMPGGMPHPMSHGMVQPTGYNTAYQPNYAHLQMMQQQMWQQQMQQMQMQQQMMQGQAALMNNGMAPLHSVPWYWNPAAPQSGQ